MTTIRYLKFVPYALVEDYLRMDGWCCFPMRRCITTPTASRWRSSAIAGAGRHQSLGFLIRDYKVEHEAGHQLAESAARDATNRPHRRKRRGAAVTGGRRPFRKRLSAGNHCVGRRSVTLLQGGQIKYRALVRSLSSTCQREPVMNGPRRAS